MDKNTDALERRTPRLSAILGVALVAGWLGSPSLASDITTRVSVGSSGGQGDGESSYPSISADGRYVAFHSSATNLVSDDTNGAYDVFVHDRQTGETTLASVNSSEVQGNGNSSDPSITADGCYVAFESRATNLVAGDTNGQIDVFVHDRQTGHTTRVSIDSWGVEGDGDSSGSSISADGRYVAFESWATNLVAGDTNERIDVFVYDRQIEQTTRVSVDSTGVEGNNWSWHSSISADGRYVAFESLATNLVAGDTNGDVDVFVHDRQSGQTTRVSVDSYGVQGNSESGVPSISADGRYVAFESWATNLVAHDTNGEVDVFVHDRQTGQTTRVSLDSWGVEGDGDSSGSSISADGRYVAFESWATNLVAGDTNGVVDAFVHDRQSRQTTRVSVDSSGVEGNNDSRYRSISADGRYAAFHSRATNLVVGDTNSKCDVFVRGPELTLQASPLVVSGVDDTLTFTTYKGIPGNKASLWAVKVDSTLIFVPIYAGSFLADGRFVVWGPVPGWLGTLDVTFRSYGIGLSGLAVATNDVTVSFQ
ncbi:MAG: hypothetical protein AB1486_29850 [Planctomycetota bacterium]